MPNKKRVFTLVSSRCLLPSGLPLNDVMTKVTLLNRIWPTSKGLQVNDNFETSKYERIIFKGEWTSISDELCHVKMMFKQLCPLHSHHSSCLVTTVERQRPSLYYYWLIPFSSSESMSPLQEEFRIDSELHHFHQVTSI